MKVITKQTTPTFKVGDKIKFHTSNNERGMSMYSGTKYGIIEKMNKVTAIVKTKTNTYQVGINEMIPYEDPFDGWA